MYTYRAKIVSVYDGDTVTALVDLGFRINMEIKIRLSRINAPEIRGPQRPQGLVARDFLRELILGKTVTIMTQKDRKEKYGRYLAEIYLDDPSELFFIHCVNDIMIESGNAKQYEG
jgi:micrococcal nuclease